MKHKISFRRKAVDMLPTEFPFWMHKGVMDYKDFPFHSHDYLELDIILGGAAIHYTNKEEYPIQAGDVFILTPSMPHGYRQIKDLYICDIRFTEELIRPYMPYLSLIPGYNALFHLEPRMRKEHSFKSKLQLNTENLGKVTNILLQMEKELNGKKNGYQIGVLSSFLSLLLFLSRAYSEQQISVDSKFMHLAQTIAFMQENFQTEMKLQELASMSCLSVNSFLRYFKKALNTTPVEYLLNLRINAASQLLRTSAKSVTEIAFETGFSDSNYFTRVFKRIMHVKPTEYRKKSFRWDTLRSNSYSQTGFPKKIRDPDS